MNMLRVAVLLCLVLYSVGSHAVDGLQTRSSAHSVAATMDLAEEAVKQRGLRVFARIDHAAGAASIGQNLRATQLLIFGDPKGGTPLMHCAQTLGIDLPLKILVWEDQAGQVWLGYNSPRYLAERHAASACGIVDKLEAALQGIAQAVTQKTQD